MKSEYFDGRLISHLVLFRIEDSNRAIDDPSSPVFGISLAAVEIKSEGCEAELSGEVWPRLSLTAGYAYTRTKYEEGAVDQQGETFSTFTPRHSFNLWTKYLLPPVFLDGVDVGLGIRSVSSFYSESGGVRFEADGYTTVQARLGYKINEHFSLSLIGNNLFDEKYYEKVSSAGRQNFYSEPRNVALVLQAQL